MTTTTTREFPADRNVTRRGIAVLADLMRTHPGPAVAAVAGSMVFSAGAVGGAIVLGRVTDSLIVPAFEDGGTTMTAALSAAGLILGVAVVRASAVVARRYFGAMATRRMQMSWFDRLTDHYLAQPLPFFQQQPTGKLLAHADADAERATFVFQPLPLSLGAAVLIVFASINLAVLDPILLLVALTLFPALGIANHLYTTQVEAPSARAQARVGDVSSIAHESLSGAEIVKLLGLAPNESARLAKAADQLRSERLELGRMRAVFNPAIDALPSLGTIAVLAVGTWRVGAGTVTAGDVVQAMTLFGVLVFPVRVVGFLLEELPRSVVAVDRLDDVLGDDHRSPPRPSTDHPLPDKPLPDGPLSIATRDVHFSYPAPTATAPDNPANPPVVLEGVDLQVAAGSVVALVGSTGSGKSTLLHLVAGLARPSGGSVFVGGVDLAEANPSSVHDAIAMVFQQAFLFATTVQENLTLGLDIDPAWIEDVVRIAQVGYIDDLPEGRQTVLGERGVSLSGGQRQRLALARALIRRPRLLLLDDATSAVDPLVEQRILEGLRDLHATTLVVAHRVATIRLADRVLYLDAGRIAADGTHEQLLATDEGYQALVQAYEEGAA